MDNDTERCEIATVFGLAALQDEAARDLLEAILARRRGA
jgi:hypothetical protein